MPSLSKCLYIWGRTIFDDELEVNHYNVAGRDGVAQFTVTELTTYITKSKPTGESNLAFPRGTIFKEYILNHRVKKDSPVANFFQFQKKSNTQNLKIDTQKINQQSSQNQGIELKDLSNILNQQQPQGHRRTDSTEAQMGDDNPHENSDQANIDDIDQNYLISGGNGNGIIQVSNDDPQVQIYDLQEFPPINPNYDHEGGDDDDYDDKPKFNCYAGRGIPDV